MEVKILKENPGKKRIFCWVCIALMLAILILQFVPCWIHDGETSSVNGLIWLPLHETHQDLMDWLSDKLGREFDINEILLFPIAQFFASIVGTAIIVLKTHSKGIAVAPFICGVAGLLVYTSGAAFLEGILWPVHIALSVLLIVASICLFIFSFKKKA